MSGVALVREAADEQHTLWLAEIEHRGERIKKALDARRPLAVAT